MVETLDLSGWLDRVSRCASRKEIFAILDEFRKGEWTDEECSQMSKHYIRLVTNMPKDKGDSDDDAARAQAQGQSEADGPVWYEKM